MNLYQCDMDGIKVNNHMAKAGGLLTQGELAGKSGVEQSELVELEDCQAEPTLRLLLQLARGIS